MITRFTSAIACLLALGFAVQGCGSSKPEAMPEATPVSIPEAAPERDLTPRLQLPSPLVLSVLQFEDRTKRPQLAWLSKGMTDMLVAELARRPSVFVVQRDRLDEVMREQSLHVTGRISDKSAVRVGRLVGANVLVTGSYSVIQRDLRIDAQLIAVERGNVLGAASAQGAVADTNAVASSLVSKVLALLHNSDAGISPRAELGGEFLSAAQANENGESLSRKGKLFRALQMYENALAVEPSYQTARSNYASTVQRLPGSDLFRLGPNGSPPATDDQVVNRVLERFLGNGFESIIGKTRYEPGSDGTLALVVPMELRLSPLAVDALLESTTSLGGKRAPGADGTAPIEFTLSSRPSLNKRFVAELKKPRRIYLRLYSRSGLTLGLYSDLRDWQVGQWVRPIDHERVHVDRQKTFASKVRFVGLTQEQVRQIGGVRLTVEPVRREQALVRAELRDQSRPGDNGGKGARQTDSLRPEEPSIFPADFGLKEFQSVLEQEWKPPITERPWAPGYLPSNKRTAIVGLRIIEDGVDMVVKPRLIRQSGDPLFDEASMASAQVAGAQLAQALTHHIGVVQVGGKEKSKIWVQYQLIKDLPPLNLISAQDQTRPLPRPRGSARRRR